jgi:hypothetical protein
MPNWVFTNLSIEGKSEDLQKFMDKASKPYTTYHKGVRYQDEDGNWKYDADKINEQVNDSPISFMNFASPEDIDAYFGASDYKPEGYDELSMNEKMAIAMKHSSDGWYDWNVRNWGTKWDACNPSLNSDDPTSGSISYSFDTAWSPAEGAFRQMVEQHPELEFTFYCEEEQGWGVEYLGSDGDLSVIKEWDIPNSHAEYAERDNTDGCVCAWNEDDPEDWYDDCPDKGEKIKELHEQTLAEVEKIEDISEMLV